MFSVKKKHIAQLSLLMSQLLSQLSDRMTHLGLIWMITTEFGEKALTWYLVIGGLPHLIFAAFSGKYIQKMGALNTVILTDIMRFLLFLSASLVSLTSLGFSNINFLYLIIFVSNIFSSFFNPAILSMPVELFDDHDDERVQKLTARLSTVSSLSVVVGPALGLILFKQFGLTGLFFMTSISYLVSGYGAFYLRRFRRDSLSFAKKGVNQDRVSRPTIRLIDTLKKNRFICLMLFVFMLMNLFLGPLQVLMPTMAKNLFQNSFNSLALMEMSLGIGIVVGGLVLSLHAIRKKELFWTWIFLMVLCFSYIGLLMTQQLYGAMFSLVIMGLTIGFANILILHILQYKPESKDVPNIMSLVNLISTASVPFSLSIFGIFQSQFSLSYVGLFCGYALLFVVILSYYPFMRWGRELFE